MREIKFRGWDKEKERMMPVTLMEFNQWWVSCMPISDTESNVLEYGERNSFRNEDTDRHVLMQYTGLKDKNGTEIYEGDIVRCWGGEQCQGYHEFDEEITVNDMTYDAYYVGQWDGCLVIGNIYENPELLK